MKYRMLTTLTLLVLLVSVTPLVAQDSDMATEYPVTVTDQSGAEVTFDAPPERVLCLGPDCIQHMAVIDVLPTMVFDFDKTSSFSPNIFGERAEEMLTFDWSEDGPDIEAMLEADVDFLVSEVGVYDYAPQISVLTDTMPAYLGYGPYYDTSVWNLENEEDWESFTAVLMDFGVIFDRQDAATAFVKDLQDRYAAYSEIADPTVTYARMRLEIDMSIFAPPCLALMSEMATCASFGDDWVQTTVEAVLDADPDVIVVEASPDREIDMDAWMEVPLWSSLSAVQNDRVIVVPYDSFYDVTPLSLYNTMDAILPALNPEVLPEGPLTDEQVEEILADIEAE